MSSFLQSKEWAAFREALGWQAHWIKDPHFREDDILVLERPLPLGKSFLYLPELDVRKLDVRKLIKTVNNNSFACQPIFLRLELLDEYPNPKVLRLSHLGGGILKTLRELKFIKAFEEVQPEWRRVIDLTLPEDELLAQMKPKGRYNISLAKRHGVMVKKEMDAKMFYKLYQDTTKRAGIKGRALIYFQKLLKHFSEHAQIYTSHYHKQPLASALVIFWDHTATYLYGGSTPQHKEVMAPSLLHWQIMKEAKRQGCTTYDLGAVAPVLNQESRIKNHGKPDSKFEILNSREKKLAAKYVGLTRFKQQFGGRTIHIIGSNDLILQPFWYRLYRFVESMRRR